jgi:tryptophan synthase alpha chain
MNRIDTLLQTKKHNILSVYFTAGYPHIDDTNNIIEELSFNGADMLEIGIPFSDSVVDGPVIQNSNKLALENGMTLKILFKQLERIRDKVSLPIILMGYLNPVLQYGMENFCKSCIDIGIDGIILPDLPLDEYVKDYREMFESYGLYNILLITPQTSDERIRKIDSVSKGFLYVVSSASTTGNPTRTLPFKRGGQGGVQEKYFDRLNRMNLKNPRLIGFGIYNNETFRRACSFANGAIVGSAFIKALSESENLSQSIKDFILTLKTQNPKLKTQN